MKGLLKNIVGAVAPTLGTAISGPLGGMAMGKIAEVLGVSNDQKSVQQAIENATPEKIFGDTLLPLAQEVRRRQKKGDFTIVCTARQKQDADFEFLMNEGINPDMILSRKVGDNRADGELKANQLRRLFNLRQFKNANKVMFDDASSVRSTLRKLGIAVIHPRKYNERAVA